MIKKIKTYLGFAIKSGKIIFGYDKLFEGKKTPSLVLICSSLNDKNTDKVKSFCENYNIKYIKLSNLLLSDIVSRNSKVVGICDLNLSQVICCELDLLNGNKKI